MRGILPRMNLVFDFGAVLFDWRPAHVVQTHFEELSLSN